WMIHRERMPLPDRIVPMLARIGDLPADDGAWAYEMKWDGLRALAYIGGGRVRLMSRTGQDLTQDYPELGGLGAAVGKRQAVQHGLEGIVAKRLASRYEPGRRTGSWRKIKNLQQQEVVVGGWKPGEGVRAGRFGSLLIGVQGDGGLEYAGHVGTGFSQQALDL